MANIFTLFLILYGIWTSLIIMEELYDPFMFLVGLFACGFLSYGARKMSFVTGRSQFFYLQFGYYKFLKVFLREYILNSFKLAHSFLNLKYKFKPVADYLLIEKEYDEESVLFVNALNLIPGSICMILKRRYIVVHSLDDFYITKNDLFELSKRVSTVHDDSLV